METSRKTFIAACTGMLNHGIVMAVLGALLPSVIARYGLANADAGSLFIQLTIGILIGSLLFGPVVDRYGYRWITIISVLMLSAGFFGIAWAPTVLWLNLSLLITGIASGNINGSTNAMVSDISEGRRGAGLNFLGVFFGLGALSVPLLLGLLLDSFSYEWIILAISAYFLVSLLYFSNVTYPEPTQPKSFPFRDALSLFREKALMLFGFVLLVQAAMETSVSGWAATLFTEVLGVDSNLSVLILSLYWAGLIAGRFIAGLSMTRFSGMPILWASLSLAMIGLLLMIFSTVPALAAVGLFLTGFGQAAVFPVFLSFTGDAYRDFS